MEPAFVSVTKNGACLDEYMRSPSWATAHAPRTIQPIGPEDRGADDGCARPSSIS